MFTRQLIPSSSNSFFIFGPRGTGKTTLIKQLLEKKEALQVNLLDPSTEDRLARNPSLLSGLIKEAKPRAEWVFIDEVQKNPRLLDLVHLEIESSKELFALTGSSARKLKRGGANLLAGRAFVYNLFPLTYLELGSQFFLDDVLNWGSLPKIYEYNSNDDKSLFLESYAHTYLKEEIIAEQIIRKVEPFRIFLELAAQSNGDIINLSKFADSVGVDKKSIKSYFEIIEDTLLGFFLPAFDRSVRKQQVKSPKFYLFDCGVKKALERSLAVPLTPQSYGYGKAFEHYLILELYRLNHYFRKNYKFYYLQSKEGAEIDLIIDRPGQPLAIVEIKSTTEIQTRHLKTIKQYAKDMKNVEAFCLSNDLFARKEDSISVLPWREGITALGFSNTVT